MTALELRLTGADVLRPDGVEQNGELAVRDGEIVRQATGRPIDLAGYRVLPGIVDIHGDGFERHLAARRGAMKQMDQGLMSAEAELAANGITTAVLAQFHSWEGGLRAPDYADRVFEALKKVRHQLVTDLRPQLRFETHMLDDYADLPARLERLEIGYIVFNDHLPHDRLAAGRKPPRLTGQALKAGRNPEKHLEMMQEMHNRRGEVPEALDRLCADLRGRGVLMGSHDDQTAEDRATWRQRGCVLSEFPETLEAAEAARSGGDGVILGAPNVVRGGSHNGNVSALDLIAMGHCDALASDYHYPSPRRAALMLEQACVLPPVEAWALVSSGPAKLLGLRDRGQLVDGMRADLLILDKESHRVAATMSGGRISYMSGDIASRFLA